MPRNLTRGLLAGTFLLVLFAAWRAGPVFLYHSGVVATYPGETITLRFHYSDWGLWPTRLTVRSFVGEGCEGIEIMDSSSHRGLAPGSKGLVEVKIRVTREGSIAVRAAVVQLKGQEMVAPIGYVGLVSDQGWTEDWSSGMKAVALDRSFLAVPDQTQLSLNVPIARGTAVEILAPEPPPGSRITIGPLERMSDSSTLNSRWQLDIPDDLWVASSCFLFRPVVRVSSEEEESVELGPLLEILTAVRR
ncbi:MAG: hypothetical protein ACM3WU_10665 [Bacillota bacterium]